MGGARLRGARNERRCAGVVDGAGLAGGEMSEDPLDDLARLPQLTHGFDDFSGFDSRNSLFLLSPVFVTPL